MQSNKVVTVLVFCSFFSAYVFADSPREDSNSILKTAERAYKVNYPNGGVDNFVYVYEAHLTSYMKQDGQSASWKHPTDSRRCSYRVGSYIQRDGYYVTGAGARVPLNDVKKVFSRGSRANKDNTTLENVVGVHSPCNNYVSDMNSKKASISSALITDFDTLMLSDESEASVIDAEKVMPGAKLISVQKN